MTQPALFTDRSSAVDVSGGTPTVPCWCGLEAPRVAVCCGLDLHECRCGIYMERRHCCGLIMVHPEPTAEYRRGRICPNCARDRYPEVTYPVDLGDAND
jgi:hypothetical protein